ncbi:hypothetical protein WN865_01175 [Tetragenococcus halophilus]
MRIQLSEQAAVDTLGETILLGVNVRHPYNEETRERDESVIERLRVRIAAKNLDDSIEIDLADKELPNVKNWGKVKIVNLEYNPTAIANTFGSGDNVRSFGQLRENFNAVRIEPATPGDRAADENGEKTKEEKK